MSGVILHITATLTHAWELNCASLILNFTKSLFKATTNLLYLIVSLFLTYSLLIEKNVRKFCYFSCLLWLGVVFTVILAKKGV